MLWNFIKGGTLSDYATDAMESYQGRIMSDYATADMESYQGRIMSDYATDDIESYQGRSMSDYELLVQNLIKVEACLTTPLII